VLVLILLQIIVTGSNPRPTQAPSAALGRQSRIPSHTGVDRRPSRFFFISTQGVLRALIDILVLHRSLAHLGFTIPPPVSPQAEFSLFHDGKHNYLASTLAVLPYRPLWSASTGRDSPTKQVEHAHNAHSLQLNYSHDFSYEHH
jgi:hypothetical protein